MRLSWQRLFLPHWSLQPQATLQQSNRQDNQDVLPGSNLIDGGLITAGNAIKAGSNHCKRHQAQAQKACAVVLTVVRALLAFSVKLLIVMV